MKVLLAAALALLATPAHAQTAETCLTQTIFGQEISPPMCFTPESIAPTGGSGWCEWVTRAPGVNGGRCITDRPVPPTAEPLRSLL